MKKLFIALFAVCVLLSFTEPKRYTLTLDEQQANALLYVIDKSNAEHLTVKAVQELVVRQLHRQLSDTTKKTKH